MWSLMSGLVEVELGLDVSREEGVGNGLFFERVERRGVLIAGREGMCSERSGRGKAEDGLLEPGARVWVG